MKLHRHSSKRKTRRKNDHLDSADLNILKQQLQDANHTAEVKGEERTQEEWTWEELKVRLRKFLKGALVALIAISVSILYLNHVRGVFESTTKFSMLTEVERELSLPTDVALRYSWFKQVALAPSYVEGIQTLTNDSTESTANSFHRFHLLPEVTYAGVFRTVSTFGLYSHISSFSGRVTFDLVEFYVMVSQVLEAVALGVFFLLGFKLSNYSLVGALTSTSLFVLLHPQRTNYILLLPSEAKTGWAFALIQVYTLSRVVFSKLHSSWWAAPKLAISTAALILFWPTESQWFLLSQLLIVFGLHLFGYLSRYVASLVVFGQLTGYQYATLVSFDPSMHHWSLYSYALAAVVVTVFGAEPVLDWILGAKRQKHEFLRRIILVIIFQIALMSWRCDLGANIRLLEDARFPLGQVTDEDAAAPSMFAALSLNATEESKLEAFLKLCFISRAANTSLCAFVSKHFFLFVGFFYAVLTSMVLPAVSGNFKGRNCCDESLARRGDCEKKENDDGNLIKEQPSFRLLSLLLLPWKAVKFFLSFSAVTTILFSAEPENGDEETTRRNKRQQRWWEYSAGEKLFYDDGSRDGDESSNEKLWNNEAFQLYMVLQTAAYGIYAIHLNSTEWELFFVGQICLCLSLLGNFKVVLEALKQVNIEGLRQLHIMTMIGLLSVIVAGARVRGYHSALATRGRFEIGNPRISNLQETLEWVQTNVPDDALFSGADNLVVALRTQTAGTATSFATTVPALLTIHSFANKQELSVGRTQVPFKNVGGRQLADLADDEDATQNHLEKDVIRSGEPASTSAGNQNGAENAANLKKLTPAQLADATGPAANHPVLPAVSRLHNLEQPKETQLPIQQVERNSSATFMPRMTSRMDDSELETLLKVYAMYSRKKSIREYHQQLASVTDITHLLLSREMCPGSQTETEVGKAMPVLRKHKRAPASTSMGDSYRSAKEPSVARGATAHMIYDESDADGSDRKASTGSWQWDWNWQQGQRAEREEGCKGWSRGSSGARICDLTFFWDLLEKPKGPPMESSAEIQKTHKVSRFMAFRERQKPQIHRFTTQQPRTSFKDPNSSEDDTEVQQEPIICRLLYERNIWPFERIFQNSQFTVIEV